LKPASSWRAAELRVEHGDELIPAAEAFAMPVGFMAGGHSIEAGAGDGFEEFLKLAYPDHVAGVEKLSWHSGFYPVSPTPATPCAFPAKFIPDSSAPSRE
jgi:hypothetical protein